MQAPDLWGFGLQDLFERNPLLKAAGLAGSDFDNGAWSEGIPTAAGRNGMPGSGSTAASAPPIRRTAPVPAVPYESPTGLERFFALAAPFAQVWLQTAMLPTRRQRRRALAPGLVAAGAQDVLSWLSFGRQKRAAERLAQQAVEDRQMQRELIRAQIEELGRRHEPQEKRPPNLQVTEGEVGGQPVKLVFDPATGRTRPMTQKVTVPSLMFPGLGIPGVPELPREIPGGTFEEPVKVRAREFAPKTPRFQFTGQTVRDARGMETPVYINTDETSGDFGRPFVSTEEGFQPFTGIVKREPAPARPAKPRSPQPRRGTPAQFAQLERWRANELSKAAATYQDDPAAFNQAMRRTYSSYDQQKLALEGGPNASEGKVLDEATAARILAEAGGDKSRARQIAKQRGYKF